MRVIQFTTAHGEEIPLHVADVEGKTLVECRNPEPLLRHLLEREADSVLPEGSYLRGVVTPGCGARFELFDAFGSVGTEGITLSNEKTKELNLDTL